MEREQKNVLLLQLNGSYGTRNVSIAILSQSQKVSLGKIQQAEIHTNLVKPGAYTKALSHVSGRGRAELLGLHGLR